MTEAFEQKSGGDGNIGQSIEGNYQFIGTFGATGTRTANAQDFADVGATHTLALKSPQLTISVPAGTVANDVMIASIAVQLYTAGVTPPAGWTLVRRINNTANTTNSLYVYLRVAGASEPASYTWVVQNLAYAAGGIQSFSGVDISGPIDVENGQNTGDDKPKTPSVTTTVANAMLVTTHTLASSGTWTPPTGMTKAYETATTLPLPNNLGQAILGSYALQAAAGATGQKQAFTTASGDKGNAYILALTPASVPIPGDFKAYETSTAPGTIVGNIRTKVAGGTISLDIIAVNPARTAILTTFTGAVKVEVLNSSDNSGALNAATRCRSSWTVIQTLSPNPSLVAGDAGRDQA